MRSEKKSELVAFDKKVNEKISKISQSVQSYSLNHKITLVFTKAITSGLTNVKHE